MTVTDSSAIDSLSTDVLIYGLGADKEFRFVAGTSETFRDDVYLGDNVGNPKAPVSLLATATSSSR